MILCLFCLEDDFKTDVDLRVACLILDKQVKLINGNETNILIPQIWMKKYFDDQEQGIDRQEPEVKQTPEIHSMNFILFFFIFNFSLLIQEAETPKMITTTIMRPKALPKTGIEYYQINYLIFFFRRTNMCSMSDHGTSSCMFTMRSFN